MKRVVSKLELGEGLFSDGPVKVEFDFGSCIAVFDLQPMSFDVYDELKKEGTDLADMEQENAADAGKRVFAKIVKGWSGLLDTSGEPVPFTDLNRDRLAATEIAGEIITAARELVVERKKAEEGNSES